MGRKKGSNTPRGEPDVALENGGRGWLIRKDVAKRLGMAENSVKRRDGRVFHPIQRGRLFFYDPAEVERYAEQHGPKRATRAEGEIAARAFELFEAGKDFRKVVIELQQTPARVRELFREYALGSDLIVPAAICREIESLGHGRDGEALSAQELRRIVVGLHEGTRNLSTRSVDDFNKMQRLANQLRRAEERIGELEAALKQRTSELEAALKRPAEPPPAGETPGTTDQAAKTE